MLYIGKDCVVSFQKPDTKHTVIAVHAANGSLRFYFYICATSWASQVPQAFGPQLSRYTSESLNLPSQFVTMCENFPAIKPKSNNLK